MIGVNDVDVVLIYNDPQNFDSPQKRGSSKENLKYFQLNINDNVNSKYIGYRKTILKEVFNTESSKINSLKALT